MSFYNSWIEKVELKKVKLLGKEDLINKGEFGKNLIKNPSFELINKDDDIVNWKYSKKYVKLSEDKKDGNYSIMVPGNSINKSSWANFRLSRT